MASQPADPVGAAGTEWAERPHGMGVTRRHGTLLLTLLASDEEEVRVFKWGGCMNQESTFVMASVR